MAATDHWMRFNVGDYLADTMHLSTFQHGIYVLLIMHYFKRGELPSDDPALARIAHTSVPQWRRQSAPVMSLFTRQGEHWVHRRIDAERERARNISEVKQAAGKQGASRRWAMAHVNGEDSTCHPENGEDSRDHAGARASLQPQPTTREAPPLIPPDLGGERRARRINGGGERVREPKNGFVGSTVADLQETIDAKADDARRSGATVVPIPRRALSG
jgi:uncharacterized protein YdaU (DUF1376 family)